MTYTELDLPPVVERKREFLQRTDEGRAVLARPVLRLVEGDVETVTLEPFVRRGEPVFVIAEGLMMYLATDARRDLFAKVRQLAATTGELRFVFDLVPTNEEPDGIVGRVLEAAMKRSMGGRSFERDARTRDDIVTSLREASFDDIETVASSDIARAEPAGPRSANAGGAVRHPSVFASHSTVNLAVLAGRRGRPGSEPKGDIR